MLIKTICWVDIILYIRLFGLRRVNFRLVRVGVGWVGGWVAGLIENITNSAKLKLELELSLAKSLCSRNLYDLLMAKANYSVVSL